MNPSQNNAGQVKLLDGNLETLGLQATLKMLALGGKTGKLHVVTDLPIHQQFSVQNRSHPDTALRVHSKETLDIYLTDGNIVGIQSQGISAINIIELFRLLGRISRQDELKFNEEKHNVFLALNRLTQYGYIYPQEMGQRLDYVVIQAIFHALRWERGNFDFEQIVEIDPFPPLSVDYILLEAIRNVDEWQSINQKDIDYLTIPRWASQFQGTISTEMLSQDEMNVLFLANGHHNLGAIAFSLLLPETRVAEIIERLKQLEMITILDTSKHDQISAIVDSVLQKLNTINPQQNADKRLQVLIMILSTGIEMLIDQFRSFLIDKKTEQESTQSYTIEYQISEEIRGTFQPIFRQIEGKFPIIETVQLVNGTLDLQELGTIDTVVRGKELTRTYFQAAAAFHAMFVDILSLVVMQELGHTQYGIKVLDHWKVVSKEVDGELQRLQMHFEN